MPNFKGFFKLETAPDLLQKLRHDLSRIRQDPGDTYAAFDFIVTGEHMLDWKYPGGRGTQNEGRRRDLRKTEPSLRVIWDLASGAKHFEAAEPRHKSVESVRTQEGYFSSEYFSPEYFDTGSRIVKLKGDEARSLGSEITVLDLAERVLQYWEAHLASP